MSANLTPEPETREGTSVLHITATDARLRLGEMIDAAISGDRVVIHRHGKQLAALVGMRELEALESAA